MRRLGFLACVWTLSCSQPVESPATDEWQALKQRVRREFPEVEHLPVERFAELAREQRVVDVRAPEEFAVSRIPDADNVPWGADFVAAFDGVDKAETIVLYCSVGYRSSMAARALEQAGFTNVENLEGSIFEWANEGFPLQTPDGHPASTVHPFDAKWGKLLREELRAPLK